MHAFIWIFLAIAMALMLFSSIQPDLPDELSFLKGTMEVDVVPEQPGLQQFKHLGWLVQESPGVTSLTKAFQGPLVVNGTSYEAPELGVLCYQGTLNVRIDSKVATTGTKTSVVTFAGRKESWDKGAAGMNLLAPQPLESLKALVAEMPRGAASLSYRDLGAQHVGVDTTGLSELVARMAPTCRPS